MNNWTEQNGKEIVNRERSVRSKDLATRQRVNFVLSNSTMSQLRSKSEEAQMPMSRIIEAALTEYYTKSTPHMPTASLTTGVSLYHLFEIIIAAAIDSDFVKHFFEFTKKYFDNYTYSSCLLKDSPSNSASIGTKIMLYLSDDQNNQLSTYLSVFAKQTDSGNVRLYLDGKEIQA